MRLTLKKQLTQTFPIPTILLQLLIDLSSWVRPCLVSENDFGTFTDTEVEELELISMYRVL